MTRFELNRHNLGVFGFVFVATIDEAATLVDKTDAVAIRKTGLQARDHAFIVTSERDYWRLDDIIRARRQLLNEVTV